MGETTMQRKCGGFQQAGNAMVTHNSNPSSRPLLPPIGPCMRQNPEAAVPAQELAQELALRLPWPSKNCNRRVPFDLFHLSCASERWLTSSPRSIMSAMCALR
jgi:hypothetical protein